MNGLVNEAAIAGGAIETTSSSVLIVNTSFLKNSVTSSGGAILSVSSSLNICNCLFKKNTAQRLGGAISSIYPEHFTSVTRTS